MLRVLLSHPKQALPRRYRWWKIFEDPSSQYIAGRFKRMLQAHQPKPIYNLNLVIIYIYICIQIYSDLLISSLYLEMLDTKMWFVDEDYDEVTQTCREHLHQPTSLSFSRHSSIPSSHLSFPVITVQIPLPFCFFNPLISISICLHFWLSLHLYHVFVSIVISLFLFVSTSEPVSCMYFREEVDPLINKLVLIKA